MKEAGHSFLARLGKTKLRPGGIDATNWLLNNAHLNKDSKVLEVACNMGTTMIKVANEYGCSVTGIDMDAKAIEKAKANIAKNHLEDQLQVMQGNAFSLPFDDHTFDVVINEAMLTMLTGNGKEKALKEYQRVLKPGGCLLTHDVALRTADEETQKELREGLSRVINVKVEPLTVEKWKDLIENAGFKTTQKYGPMTLMDPEGMIRDEGKERAEMIMKNAMKEENKKQFTEMYNFFNGHKDELGYVANFSIKE